MKKETNKNDFLVFFLKNAAGDGGGEGCLKGNLWYSPPANMTSRLASVTFKITSKVFIEETDKKFDFITEYRSFFLDLEILRFLLS